MSCERFAEALWGLKAAVRPRNVEGDVCGGKAVIKLYGGCNGRYKVFDVCVRQGFGPNVAAARHDYIIPELSLSAQHAW